MTRKLLKKIANSTDNAMVAGGVIAAAGLGAAQTNPGAAHVSEAITLLGLGVATVALCFGMANSLKNAD